MPIQIKTKYFNLSFGKPEEKNVPEIQLTAQEEKKEEIKQPKVVKMPVKEYTFSPLKTALLPTPAELKQAIIGVDSDPRPMLDIIRKLAIADMHLLGIIETRRDALLGYDFDIAPADPEDEKEQKRCDEMKNRFVKSNFTELLKNLQNGRLYGHSVTIPHWNLDFDNKRIASFENVDFIHFTKKDGRLQLIADKSDTSFHETIGSNSALLPKLGNDNIKPQVNPGSGNLNYYDLDDNVLIIMQSNPFEGLLKNYIGGLLRPALYLTLLKHYNILDWAKFNELFGMPMRIGKFDPLLSGDEAIAILKTAVKNLGTDAAAVIDKTTEIELKESTNVSRTNTYNDFGGYVESKQSVLILGQTLTTEVTAKFGSRALGDVHNLVRMDKLYADIIATEQIVSGKLVMMDYFYNYGIPPNGVYPKFKIRLDEYKDLSLMSAVIRELSGAGLEISKSWAYEFFDIQAPADENDSFGGKNPLGLL